MYVRMYVCMYICMYAPIWEKFIVFFMFALSSCCFRTTTSSSEPTIGDDGSLLPYIHTYTYTQYDILKIIRSGNAIIIDTVCKLGHKYIYTYKHTVHAYCAYCTYIRTYIRTYIHTYIHPNLLLCCISAPYNESPKLFLAFNSSNELKKEQVHEVLDFDTYIHTYIHTYSVRNIISTMSLYYLFTCCN